MTASSPGGGVRALNVREALLAGAACDSIDSREWKTSGGPVAGDFLRFCQGTPRPCPLLDVTDAGSPVPERAAPEADRSDLPRYRVWREGRLVEEPADIRALWQNDFVSFLIGCSFTFESALL